MKGREIGGNPRKNER